MKKKSEERDGAEEMSFEKALARLEAIVDEMEGGKLSLEEMMKRFEEGQKLAALCSSRLNEIERKVEILVKQGAKIEAVPFEEGAVETQTAAEESK